MKNTFSQKEREFFVRLKGRKLSRIKILPIAVLMVLILGLLIDAFNGFFILRNARSLVWVIGGLFLFSIFYLIGEVFSVWVGSKDDVSHPMLKRLFHLFILLGIAGAVTVACWIVFTTFGK